MDCVGSDKNKFYYHHICHYCKENSINSQYCSSCKLVVYCSKEHQVNDWIYHKNICKAIKFICCNIGKDIIEICNKTQNLKLTCNFITFLLSEIIGRKVKFYELQMFMFPNRCQICNKYDYPGKNCFCENCKCVFYCSPKHKAIHSKKHEAQCSLVRFCYELNKFMFDMESTPVVLKITSIEDYTFPVSMEKFLGRFAKEFNRIMKSLLSEHLSGILTLLHALLSSQHLKNKEKLIIHLVGAEDFEQHILTYVELLFRWMPHLTTVELILIGPDTVDYNEPQIDLENKTVTIKIEKKLYHEYFINKTASPDVIFAFNCGIGESSWTWVGEPRFDTWDETIKIFWSFNNILLGFTDRREYKEDISIVMEKKPSSKKILSKFTGKNPYKSLRPIRDCDENDGCVFYNNNWISLIEIGK